MPDPVMPIFDQYIADHPGATEIVAKISDIQKYLHALGPLENHTDQFRWRNGYSVYRGWTVKPEKR